MMRSYRRRLFVGVVVPPVAVVTTEYAATRLFHLFSPAPTHRVVVMALAMAAGGLLASLAAIGRSS